MRKILLTILLSGIPGMVFGQVSSRSLAVCDGKERVERAIVVSSYTAMQMFAVNNSSGTYLSGRKQVCFFNEDATAANWIRISTHAIVLAAGDAASLFTTADNTGWPVLGSSYECFNWGPNIPIYIRRAVNSAGAAVTGYACE